MHFSDFNRISSVFVHNILSMLSTGYKLPRNFPFPEVFFERNEKCIRGVVEMHTNAFDFDYTVHTIR